MAKCLRCGADSSWIQGNVKAEPADDELATTRELLAEARELRQEQVVAAYIAGAQAVHDNWQEDRAPDFTEAADDYWATIAAAKAEPAQEGET